MSDGWTLDELAGRVAQALSAGDVRAPNGRVTEVPDGRVIRWYTTIGLVDRPSGIRGRTALYGTRHLLQLVAIKRRQAEGRSLAEIQAELAGATDLTLREVAAVPAQLFDDHRGLAVAGKGMPRQESGETKHTGEAADARAAKAPWAVAEHPAPRSRFWSRPPPVAPESTEPTAHTSDPNVVQPGASGLERPLTRDTVELLYGVALGHGTALLLPAAPSGQDLLAIKAAARPLLDQLAVRGLITRSDENPFVEGVHE